MPTYRECQVVSGPFAVWVRSVEVKNHLIIDDIAPVLKKFKGQRYTNLIKWLSSKYPWCKCHPIVGTALSGYGSRQGRLFR